MIGRKIEFEKIQAALDKDRAQIIAVYGRRRVGKTFLVNEFFGGNFAFKHTAVSPVDEDTKKRKKNLMKLQLQEFYYSLRTYGLDSSVPAPRSWAEAFHTLQNLLEGKSGDGHLVIFIDELPWMDTPKSNFLSAFEHFCNDWCLAHKRVKLLVCGSATSWILDKLIHNKGGLYGRVTMPVYVSPFTLHECRDFFLKEGFSYDEYDLCRAYLAFGGIPYYLDQFRKGLSIAQNIDAILYDDEAPLKDEYDRLFTSQFSNPDELKNIVSVLADRRSGYTRDEIIKKGKLSSGGTFSDNLSALEKSKLIMSYTSYRETELRYKLSDPFCIFYLRHVKGNTSNPHYWQENEKTPSVTSWYGYAFEDLCLGHITQIKRALGIEGVISREYPWIIPAEGGSRGAQIDLVIDRNDRVVSLCEMKFVAGEFEVKKDYSLSLMSRSQRVQELIGNRKSVSTVLVTTYGLKRGEYSSRFDRTVTLEDLFNSPQIWLTLM